jgi:hypothetical protein
VYIIGHQPEEAAGCRTVFRTARQPLLLESHGRKEFHGLSKIKRGAAYKKIVPTNVSEWKIVDLTILKFK